jgi:hypothetical protein
MKRINFSVIIMFLIIITFLALVAGWFYILLSPGSYFDIFDKYVEDITPAKNSSAFGHFDVQEYDNIIYFIDGSSDLCSMKDQKKKVIMDDVEYFLFFEDELVYALLDDEKNVYSENMQSKEKNKVAHVSAQIFLTLDNFLYIYTKDNYLYKYDRNWEEMGAVSIEKKGYDGCFERAYAADGKFVFYTEDSDVYTYDTTTCRLQKVTVPGESETEFSEDTDIIQWEGEIYYMLCYYNDGDMHDSMTRVKCAENGIYRLDPAGKKFLKVSDRVGDFIIVNNELSVVVDLFFGTTYRVKKIDFFESNKK